MSLIASASIQSDITFSLVNNSSDTQSESASLDYSVSLTNGTGSLNVNYGVIKSGSLETGAKEFFDFEALTKEIFNLQTTVQFSKIKSIIIENGSTVYGRDLNIYATGTNALTELFNGGSGNLIVKPYSTYVYSDPISGLSIGASDKEIAIENVGNTGNIDWTLIVVGVTG